MRLPDRVQWLTANRAFGISAQRITALRPVYRPQVRYNGDKRSYISKVRNGVAHVTKLDKLEEGAALCITTAILLRDGLNPTSFNTRIDLEPAARFGSALCTCVRCTMLSFKASYRVCDAHFRPIAIVHCNTRKAISASSNKRPICSCIVHPVIWPPQLHIEAVGADRSFSEFEWWCSSTAQLDQAMVMLRANLVRLTQHIAQH